MFVRTTKVKRNGKVYEYPQLVRSYRDPETGKPRHEVLLSLKGLPQLEIDNLRAALRAGKDKSAVVVAPAAERLLSPLKPDANLRYLDVAVGMEIWRQWGLTGLLEELMPSSSSRMSAAAVVRALALQRLVAPASKLEAVRWLPRTVLAAEEGGAQSFNNSRVHRVLDQLEAVTGALQAKLPRLYQERDGAFVSLFTDVTDAWFVGHGPDSACRGKTKEGRIERKIGIALMCNEKGYPVRWEVLRGNQADGPAMLDLLQGVSGLSWAGQAPVVLDRAMGTSSSIRAMADTGLRFLTALRRVEFGSYAPNLAWQSVQALELGEHPAEQVAREAAARVAAAGMQAVEDNMLVADFGLVTLGREDDSAAQSEVAESEDANVQALRLAQQTLQEVNEGRHDSLAAAAASRGIKRATLSKYRQLLELSDGIQQRILAGASDGYSLASLLQVARLESREEQELAFDSLLRTPPKRRTATASHRMPASMPPTTPDTALREVRVIAFFNPARFVEQRQLADERRHNVARFVADLNKKLSSPRSRQTPDKILAEVDRRLRRDDMLTLYRVELEQREDGRYQVRLDLDRQEWDKRRRYHGFSLLVAHPELQQEAAELCWLYRAKDAVEKDFQIIKSFVKLRPIRHRTELKVKAHVTLCMLALLLERSLGRQLGGQCSAARALEILEPCRLNRYTSDSGPALYTVTKPDDEQRSLLQTLRLQKLADDDWIREKLAPA